MDPNVSQPDKSVLVVRAFFNIVQSFSAIITTGTCISSDARDN